MFAGYMMWHYSYAFRDGFSIYKDGCWFIGNFFSFRKLGNTPFHPLGVYADSNGIGKAFSRCMGAIIRAFIMVAGAIAFVTWTIFCLAVCIVWPFLPFLTLAGLAASLVGFIQHGL